MSVRNHIACFSIGLLVIGSFTQALASNQFEDQVKARILDATSRLEAGFSHQGTPIMGKIHRQHQDFEILPINLEKGFLYAIVGGCDEDCDGIDVGLYDPEGNLIDSAIGRNNTSPIYVQPRVTEPFRLKVSIARCSAYRCTYGVGLFTQPVQQNEFSTSQLVKLLQDGNLPYALVDARDEKNFREGHIPNAISVPYNKFSEKQYRLPKDKEIPLIFYCWHEDCGMSHEAALAAKQAGYSKIFTYPDGIKGWAEAGYEIEKWNSEIPTLQTRDNE